jgi:hypothetical protein
LGLIVGLVIASRLKWRGTRAADADECDIDPGPAADPRPGARSGPSEQKRWRLRRKRRRDAPKRFGKRGR